MTHDRSKLPIDTTENFAVDLALIVTSAAAGLIALLYLILI